MYFPASPAKLLATTNIPDDRVITLVLNRRSTLFAVLKTRSIEVWSIRPSSKLVTVDRSPSSLSKYGQNVSLAWAPDGASLVVLTTTSHILNYVLQARDHPGPESTPLNPPLPIEHISTFPPSAGEGYITPYAPTHYDGRSGGYGGVGMGSSGGGEINLDSALDDIQGGQAGPAEGPVKDGFFRYSYSSMGFGVDLVLVGIARVGAGRHVRVGTLGVVQDPAFTGSGRGKNGLVFLVDQSGEESQTSGTEEMESKQELVWIPYPLKREHLRQDEPDMPFNSPSTTDLPAQTSTSTSISGVGTSARFGAGLLGAFAGGGGGSSRRAEEEGRAVGPKEWVPVDEDVELNVDVLKWRIGDQVGLPGLGARDERIMAFEHVKSSNGWFICRTTKNEVYLCRYTRPRQGGVAKRRSDAGLLGSPIVELPDWQSTRLWPEDGPEEEEGEVACVNVNMRFGLYAIGFASGAVSVFSLPTGTSNGLVEWELNPKSIIESDLPGGVTSLAWTSDGCALAIGWEKAVGIWSVAGRRTFAGSRKQQPTEEDKGESSVVMSKRGDEYLNGVSSLAWTAGSSQLLVLSGKSSDISAEIALLPVKRTNAASHHDPMNSDMPLLIADDTIEIYRGRDREPISLLDPSTNPWDHVKAPAMYIAVQWPLRYAAISHDGTLLAVAGRSGLTHYSSNTGRWKLFINEEEELAFTVKGGMVWYHHVLIVAVESNRGHELRMYSRDQELSQAKCLDVQQLPHSVVTMTLQGTTLLVLTTDNTLYQYVLTTTKDALRLVIGESMSLQGLIPGAGKVRSFTWMFPQGGVTYDLLASTLIVLVGSQLVLLEPKKSAHGGTRYESAILAEGVEAFYRHQGAGADLPHGIWAVQQTRCLLIPNVLDHVNHIAVDCEAYPTAILGNSSLIATSQAQLDERRQVPFRHFRHDIGAVLHLPYLLKWFLSRQDTVSAFRLAKASENLPYFAHSLEILLRQTTETSDAAAGFAEGVVGLLDRFPQGLDVAAAYTRKTEAEHWNSLFNLIGDPKDLFERCLTAQPPKLDTASRYLIAIRHRGQSDFEIHADTTRLLKLAFESGEMKLCEDIIRFLDSVDSTGDLKKQSLATLVEATRNEQA